METFTAVNSTEMTSSMPSLVAPINPYLKLIQLMQRYSPLVLFTVGVIGNGLSAAVFSRKSMRYSTTSFLFVFLAVADSSTLVFGFGPIILNQWFHLDRIFAYDGNCKALAYVSHVASHFAVWVLMVISLERLVCVYVPHKAKLIVSKRKLIVALVSIFIVMTGAFAIIIASAGSIVIRDGNEDFLFATCSVHFNPSIRHISKTYVPWLRFMAATAIPFCFMFVINIAIIVKVIVSRRMLASSQTTSTSKLSSMTAMLLLNSTVFLILEFPTGYVYLAKAQPTSPSDYLLGLVVQTMHGCQFAINFFIYCLAGTRFRKELQNLFSCKP